MTVDHPDLAVALADWLPAQRWFGGKGREITAVTVLAETTMRTKQPSLHHLVVQVDFANGPTDVYQVPIGLARGVPEHLTSTEIGSVGDLTAYDAVHDAEFSQSLLKLMARNRSIGALAFRRGLPTEDASPLDTTLHGRILGAEQSNSSLLYGESYILKLFRRLVPGQNPDLELTRALAESGSTAVPRPLGWIEGHVAGQPTTFALLQEYVQRAVDGWALAETSVRDLLAEADLHADEVGGDFASEASRLGATTAAVHTLLAETFPATGADRNQVRAIAAAMAARVTEAGAEVPELQPYEEPLRAAFAEFGSAAEPLRLQRIHGDFHLGQVLRTDQGWMLIDFEGEPSKSVSERVAPDSALRDVAGMLRSFDYAARHLLVGSPAEPQLEYRANEWAERNRESFCDGYAEAAGADPRKSAVALRAYELDKAVYEVVYEARHRPSWLPIPLAALERLVT